MTRTPPQPRPAEGRRRRTPQPRLILAIVLVVVAVLFILQNRNRVDINPFAIHLSAPAWVLLTVMVLLGMAIGRWTRGRR